MGKRALVVDDEKLIVKGIRFSLEQDGMEVDCAFDGEEALEYAKNNQYDIVLLDIMLPKLTGFEVCQQIREFSNVPIIMLTAKGDDMDKILGLEYGADDYITKPFSLMVLRARVSVQLRNKEAAAKNSMELDGFEFYFDKMEFFKDGEPIELSKTEQKLLRVLCENRGKVLKREYLIDEVWQGDTEFVDAHALTVAIKRLRDKLEDDTQKPEYIKTVYGIGYTWAVNG